MNIPRSLGHPLFHRHKTRVFSNTFSVMRHKHLSRIENTENWLAEEVRVIIFYRENSMASVYYLVYLSPSNQWVCVIQHP